MSNTAGESRFFVDLSHHNSDECLTYACDQCERGGREGQFLPLRQTPTGDTLVICDTCEQQGFPTADDIAATIARYLRHLFEVVACIGGDAPEQVVTAALTERMKCLGSLTSRQKEILELAVKSYYLLAHLPQAQRLRVTENDGSGFPVPSPVPSSVPLAPRRSRGARRLRRA